MGEIGLLITDFILSFTWVWSGVLVKILVFEILGFQHDDTIGEIVKLGFSLIHLFLFAVLIRFSKGGNYNPLTVLAAAIPGGFSKFLFTVGARIPAQVLGAIYGVRLLIYTFPEIVRGPNLNVDIHHGALTEGLLTFITVSVSKSLSIAIPGSFVTKTWISSLSKLTLQIIGSDLTGGVMNPASVTGWAHARGDHRSKEHVIVYWLAPVEGMLLSVWVSGLLFQKSKANTNTNTSANANAKRKIE